jgi:hypothetical protein
VSARRTVPAPEVARGAGVVEAISETRPTGVLRILSQREAERMTQEIKLTASGIRNNLFKLRNQIDVAKNSNVWAMTGFSSWTAWLSDTLSEEPMRVSREERLELVEYLAGEGLSARAIAPIVGIGKSQVAKDIAEVSTSGHENPALPGMPDEVEDVTPRAPEVSTPVVHGLDGKTYPKPNLRVVTATAITDDARAAGIALRKAIERLDRIRNDERFPGYREQILADMTEHLGYARDVLTDYGVENLLADPSKEN